MNLSWIFKLFMLGSALNKCASGQSFERTRNPYNKNCNTENFIAGLRAFSDNIPSYQTKNDFLNCAPNKWKSYIDCGTFEKIFNMCQVNVINLEDKNFDNECANRMVKNGLRKRKGEDFNFKNEPCVIKYKDKTNYDGLAKIKGRRRN